MRLTYLRLKNFMSHASTELDLSGIRAAVGSGPTGGGKSALFVEAPLWALFGRVRSKRADGWVKIGADECQVEVGFDSNGTSYRVVRSRSLKTKAGKSDLQLAAKNGAGWIPLSGKSIAETQTKIEQVLGVSYDTITSANISRQKESDKFTNPGVISLDGHQYAGAQARIQVLAQMLGLGTYAEWRQTASGAARDIETQAGILEAQMADIDRTLATRPERESELAEAEAFLAGSQAEQAKTSAKIQDVTRDLAELEAKIPRAHEDLAAFAEDRAALWSREKTVAERTNKAEYFRNLLARRSEIQAQAERAAILDASLAEQRQTLAGIGAEGKGIAAQLKTAEAQVAEADRRLQAADKKLGDARRAIERKPLLETSIRRLSAARQDRQACADRIRLADEAIASHRATLDAAQRANQAAQKTRGEILAEEKRVGAEKGGIEPQIAGHEKRTAVMETVPCIGVGDLPQRCPLLKDARESVPMLAILRVKRNDLCAWVRPALPDLQPTQELDATLRTVGAEKAKNVASLGTLEREIGKLQPCEAELASLETIAAGIPDLETERARAFEHRDTASHAEASLRGALEACRQRYTTLQAALAVSEVERAALQSSVDLLADLAQAERELPGLEAEIHTLAAEVLGLSGKLAKEGELATWLVGAEASVNQIQADLAVWRKCLADEQKTERDSMQRAASARAELERLSTLAAEQTAASSEAAALRARHSLLLALAEAYRQIPLMILETMAIPALEEEANRILGRISSNGMWIRLATQRAVKSRETLADALDIIVTDTVGERSYEEYSGGENFEVDLALRIALAKLQARKAGATIQTLILDEGMGTQSGDRLDALVAALREIQNDFPMLLVITHVEALKETFPARIEISGGPRNSVAELITA